MTRCTVSKASLWSLPFKESEEAHYFQSFLTSHSDLTDLKTEKLQVFLAKNLVKPKIVRQEKFPSKNMCQIFAQNLMPRRFDWLRNEKATSIYSEKISWNRGSSKKKNFRQKICANFLPKIASRSWSRKPRKMWFCLNGDRDLFGDFVKKTKRKSWRFYGLRLCFWLIWFQPHSDWQYCTPMIYIRG